MRNMPNPSQYIRKSMLTEVLFLKIVFVTKGFHSAAKGAESAARDWYLRIRERVEAKLLTDEPTIVGHSIRKGPLSFLVAANPATFVSYAISMSRALKRVCNEVKPDLVHIHSYSGYITIPPIGLPTLVTFHDEPFLALRDPVSPAATRFLSSSIRHSQDFMRELILSRRPYVHATGTTTSTLIGEKYPKIEARVIPNPFFIANPPPPSRTRVQTLEELGIPTSARIVLTVGHVENRKAVHKILGASLKLGHSSDIHFIVAGKAPNFVSRAYSRAVEKLVVLHGTSRFHMTGYVDDVTLHNLFCHSDVYLSASQSEACNLALIEAASYRIPIVTTDVGAAKDLFLEEAFFLNRNCTDKDIARAVCEMVGRPRVDYEVLRSITWENAMQKLLDFYDHIANH